MRNRLALNRSRAVGLHMGIDAVDTGLFQRGIAFGQESRGADAQETEVARTDIANLLCRVFRDHDCVTRSDRKRCLVADPHQALPGLDDVPLEYRQLMQLRSDTGLHASARE